MADLMKRGHKIALPYGEDWPFDLVVMRAGRFERVQCKTGRLRDGAVVFDCSATRKYDATYFGSPRWSTFQRVLSMMP